MANLRSNKPSEDQRSTDLSCTAIGALVLLVGLLFQSPRVAAQTAPATLPDLKLSTSSYVSDIAVQDDGKVIIAGDFVSVNDVPRSKLARLNPNGSVDLTWNPKISGSVSSIAISGSNIYLGGVFSMLDEPGRVALARVSAVDGSTDKNWGPSVDGGVSVVAAIGADVYVGGYFRLISQLTRSNLAKLSATGIGEVDPEWGPEVNGSVQMLSVIGNDLFVSGDFTRIGG